ncbi:MAG TPA: ATP synthase F1 subunit gamma, partial [Terriglobales bacterium]|nr:ATP synthase F1 subunit gamma [Terriglobales bacterium]
MASLKVLRRRIRSASTIQQITKAMEMVSAAKLRRAQGRALATRPYARALTRMLGRLAAEARERELPGLAFLTAPADGRPAALVVITADRGLCGGFNAALFRAAEERLAAAEGRLGLVVVGRKGRDFFRRRRLPVLAVFTDVGTDANVGFARRVTTDALERFARGEVGRVDLLYTRFESIARRRVTFEPFLPIAAEDAAAAPGVAGAGRAARDVIFEPGLEPLFEALLPRFAVARMLAALADSRASEEAARMLAMEAANKNAGELLDILVLQRNRLRQNMITREI